MSEFVSEKGFIFLVVQQPVSENGFIFLVIQQPKDVVLVPPITVLFAT